ncbi:MAG: PEP-utilizing enzyme, partial [Planctomycetota bacterium]
GEVYNDRIGPDDPYEFVDLLGTEKLAGLERNRKLETMAAMVRDDPDLAAKLRAQGAAGIPHELGEAMDAFLEEYGSFSRPDAGGFQGELGRANLTSLLLEMAARQPARAVRKKEKSEAQKERFLAAFDPDQQEYAAELLALGRASYRLRDDDNIYLEKVERQLHNAQKEGQLRVLDVRGLDREGELELEEIVLGLQDPGYTPAIREKAGKREKIRDRELKTRQLVGQPAGPGVARGKARVINDAGEIFKFKEGEILVCDAVDPGMTFVVPLAAGIVERRGGMLIHGAIIAREYGLPCVTGVPKATSRIHTGDRVTVDGYLGLVIVG